VRQLLDWHVFTQESSSHGYAQLKPSIIISIPMKRTFLIFFPVFGMFNEPSWLFYYAVSNGSCLHGQRLWPDLVTQKPRLPSFSKAIATVPLTSPLYKMTRYRLSITVSVNHDTSQHLSAAKVRMH
jgi:hypothetical protein